MELPRTLPHHLATPRHLGLEPRPGALGRAGRAGAERLLVVARPPTSAAQADDDHDDHRGAGPPPAPSPGTPAPGGPVPQRPALAVKIDNYPAARPRAAWTRPTSSSRSRSKAASPATPPSSSARCTLVGPVRSARNIDIGILGQLGTPLLVHVGGIDPVLANIDASPIVNVDLGDYGRSDPPPGRVAPYDTYSSTAQMWGTHPTMTTPPQPLFTYSAKTPPAARRSPP
jgi:hypothetical protein